MVKWTDFLLPVGILAGFFLLTKGVASTVSDIFGGFGIGGGGGGGIGPAGGEGGGPSPFPGGKVPNLLDSFFPGTGGLGERIGGQAQAVGAGIGTGAVFLGGGIGIGKIAARFLPKLAQAVSEYKGPVPLLRTFTGTASAASVRNLLSPVGVFTLTGGGLGVPATPERISYGGRTGIRFMGQPAQNVLNPIGQKYNVLLTPAASVTQ